MANELAHTTVGTSLTQTEFEAIGLHVCDSQATGDVIYASSSTQLSRLGIGSTNKVLTVIGGVPTWQSTLAGLTLTSPTINGTIATTGLTLPAVTFGGALTINDQTLTGIARFSAGLATGGQAPSGNVQNYFAGNFTSDGSSTNALKNAWTGVLTGFGGDTAFLTHHYMGGTTITQTAAETIGVVSQIYVVEPVITKNVTTITVASSIYIASAPTEGTTNAALAIAAGDVKFLGSLDSAAIADQVAIGGYEISAGHRALAISSEEVVVVDVDESKFSHKLPVRINGATYNIMLCAT